MTHGVEGDGQPAPEEQDEVDGQLVPGTTTARKLLSQTEQKKDLQAVQTACKVVGHSSLRRYPGTAESNA
jgi:hypothetical protein